MREVYGPALFSEGSVTCQRSIPDSVILSEAKHIPSYSETQSAKSRPTATATYGWEQRITGSTATIPGPERSPIIHTIIPAIRYRLPTFTGYWLSKTSYGSGHSTKGSMCWTSPPARSSNIIHGKTAKQTSTVILSSASIRHAKMSCWWVPPTA